MKTLAQALAIAAGLIFFLPLGMHHFCDIDFTPAEYATFVGGTAGPLLALSGLLFKNLIQQRNQRVRESFESRFFILVEHYTKRQIEFLKEKPLFFKNIRRIKNDVINFSRGLTEKGGELHLHSPVELENINMKQLEAIYNRRPIFNGTQILIKVITIILNQIDSAPKAIEKTQYESILTNLMTATEKMLLVSYVILDKRELADNELRLLLAFCKNLEDRYHIFPHFYTLLQKQSSPFVPSISQFHAKGAKV